MISIYQFVQKQVQMETDIKMENNAQNQTGLSIPNKKEKVGRWTSAQAYLFQTLLQKYGKNWKKIHQYMKGRSLSQIRSHGQKYFDKIGAKKVEQLQRRAKLLEAYETLQKQKKIMETIQTQMIIQAKPTEKSIEQESQTEVDSPPLKVEHATASDKPSEIIKEQVKQTQIIKEQIPNIQAKTTYFFNQYEGGFLYNLLRTYPQGFAMYDLNQLIQYPQVKTQSFTYY